MLILDRHQGDWVEVIHKSGDVLRINFRGNKPGNAKVYQVGFEEDGEGINFDVRRPGSQPKKGKSNGR